MMYELIVIYLGGWVVVTIGLYGVGKHFSDRRSPAPHPLAVSVIAAALWPLLLVGMVELTSAAMYARVHKKDEPSVGILA
jgi:hypothetical protein